VQCSLRSAALRWRARWLAASWLILAAIGWLSLAPAPAPPKLEFEQADKLGQVIGRAPELPTRNPKDQS
jgi:hypothetical protein